MTILPFIVGHDGIDCDEVTPTALTAMKLLMVTTGDHVDPAVQFHHDGMEGTGGIRQDAFADVTISSISP